MDPRESGVLIRPANFADAADVARLLDQLGYPATTGEVATRFGYWLSDPMSGILVAEAASRVVAVLSMHAIPDLKRTGRWLRIESLVVDESLRGTGIGRRLVEAAEAAARDWDCLAIEITSKRSRADAHAFYLRLGYADVCGRSGRLIKSLDPVT